MPKLKLFFAALLILLVAGVCSPSKSKDSIDLRIRKDTLPNTIEGKVLFKIKNQDFFENKKGKRINSLDEFRNYIPIFFYVKKGEFYIPNRLDNIIYKINRLGKVIERISLPEEFDIAQFYITGEGEKYILNRDKGLTVYSKEGKKMYENLDMTYLIPNFSKDNLLAIHRYDRNNKVFAFTDIKGIMNEPFIYNAHYCDYSFDDKFLFEMSYDDMPNMITPEEKAKGFGKGVVIFKKYDLRTLELVSKDSIVKACKSCFDMPQLLSEELIVASNFSNAEKPINELTLFSSNGSKKIELVSPVQMELLNDVYYIGRMNLGFVYSLDKSNNKLYSLGTTEKEVVVIEYQLPDH
jgi:hypothetical protein